MHKEGLSLYCFSPATVTMSGLSEAAVWIESYNTVAAVTCQTILSSSIQGGRRAPVTDRHDIDIEAAMTAADLLITHSIEHRSNGETVPADRQTASSASIWSNGHGLSHHTVLCYANNYSSLLRDRTRNMSSSIIPPGPTASTQPHPRRSQPGATQQNNTNPAHVESTLFQELFRTLLLHDLSATEQSSDDMDHESYSHHSPGGSTEQQPANLQSSPPDGSTSRVSGGSTSQVSGGSTSQVSGGSTSRVSGVSTSQVSGGSTSQVSGGSTSQVSGGSTSQDPVESVSDGVEQDSIRLQSLLLLLQDVNLQDLFTRCLSSFYYEVYLWLYVSVMFHPACRITRNRLHFLSLASDVTINGVAKNLLLGYLLGFQHGRARLYTETRNILEEMSMTRADSSPAITAETVQWLEALSVELGVHLNPRQMLRSFGEVVASLVMQREPLSYLSGARFVRKYSETCHQGAPLYSETCHQGTPLYSETCHQGAHLYSGTCLQGTPQCCQESVATSKVSLHDQASSHVP